MPTIVVIGASKNREKFGNKCVRAYAQKGYKVYPVNPKGGTIEGFPAFKSMAEVPDEKIDLVSLYLPPQLGMTVLPEIAKKDVGEVWLNPGSESPELIAKAEQLGLNVIVACSIVDIGVSPSSL